MNVFDNIAFGLRMRKLDKEEVHNRVSEAMARVRLGRVRGAPELTALRRPACVTPLLARAIVINPKVLPL